MAEGRHFDLRLDELQGRLRDVAAGTLTLREALDSDPLLGEAERRMAAYADRLVLFQGSGGRTDVAAAGDAVSRFAGEPCVLFVDYVQKVPVRPDGISEGERVGRVVESLKELALDHALPVVAISAADREGLKARRVHLHHFCGSAALAYEADAVVVLNDKLDVVSKAQVAYTTNRIEEFRREVVFSVEKNRSGLSDVDLEFVKDFGHYRFDPLGSWLAERLWRENSLEGFASEWKHEGFVTLIVSAKPAAAASAPGPAASAPTASAPAASAPAALAPAALAPAASDVRADRE